MKRKSPTVLLQVSAIDSEKEGTTMKQYTEVILEVIRLETIDILTVSGDTPLPETGESIGLIESDE